MTKIFIFHGIGGHPEENWFPWLKAELEKAGYQAFVPAFPRPDHPNLTEWITHFENNQRNLDGQSILVGHSLGSAFALRLLERRRQPVRATFLVASVWGVMGNEFDPLMASFTEAPYDWKTIRRNAGKIHVIGSDNDPYIAPEKTAELAKNLSVDVTWIANGGHLNTAAGFTAFERLWKEMWPLLSSAKEN